jgi:hypothetical protein
VFPANAGLVITTVVPSTIESINVPDGIPAPEIVIPGCNPVVDATVTVVAPEVVAPLVSEIADPIFNVCKPPLLLNTTPASVVVSPKFNVDVPRNVTVLFG